MSARRVAVVGATGAVGREMVRILEERDFPLEELVLFSSSRSGGKHVPFRGPELTVRELTSDSLRGFDVTLLSAGGRVSREVVPGAAAAGVVRIDNSPAYRMDPTVPLVTS